MSDEDTSLLGGPQPFPATSWSLIHRCEDSRSMEFRTSLDELFRKYWPPVYYHIRRHWGVTSEEAKDLTQSFFTAFLERDFLASVSQDKGRFRTFVCASLRNFLLNERRRQKAKKRSPSAPILSIDALGGDDSVFDVPDPEGSTPEEELTAEWRRAVIESAIARLRSRAEEAGREHMVDLLMDYDLKPPAKGRPTYRELADSYGLTEANVCNLLLRGRREFVEALRAEVRDQVSTEEDFEAEVVALFGRKL